MRSRFRMYWRGVGVKLCAGIVALLMAWFGYNALGNDAPSAPIAADVKIAADLKPAGAAAALVEIDKQFAATVKPIFNKYCYQCHGNGKHKGDVSLDRYTSLQQIQADHRTWGTVADVLTQKAMPPEDEDQPTPVERTAVVRWIADALSHCDCTGPRDPGRVAIHRLNRNEYNNTIRDLIGIDFQPARDFPADDSGYGFDNIADVLGMSPLLAEKYLTAAEQVLDKAVVLDNSAKPHVKKYEASGLEATNSNAGGDLVKNGECFGFHDFALDGEYEFRLRAGQDKFGDEPAKMELRLDDKTLETFDVPNRRNRPKVFKFKTRVEKGRHKFAAAYTNNKVDNDNPDPKKRGDRNLYVFTIEIDGPYGATPPPLPEPHQRIFFVTPSDKLSEADAARQIVERFATRAFRRPASSDEVEGLTALYRSARDQGEKHEEAVKLALEAALVSPQFLYRIEVDPPHDTSSAEAARNAPPHAISDFELATRLSYFLWSSMPDDELFKLAGENRLHEPAVLDAQVKRMLADGKSRSLVANFTGQWLELRNLDDFKPDMARFPEFDEKLRESMKKETELFFANVVHEDRSVLELLDADYTFINERLARHYGIDGIKGDDFQRVNLSEAGPDRAHRGGVLTMGSVLTVTAMPTRTSPVKRGKFILQEILGTPPPPPPADVPALPDKPQDETAGSLRQRLERHRADPSCSVCHMRMDPLGFAMENYSALGQWREKDSAGFVIDAAGKLPDGTALDGPTALRKVLLARKNDFVRCLVEKLMTYALGRGVEYYDTCTVRDIAHEAGQNDDRFSAVISAIVKSDAFTKRRPFVEPKVTHEKRAKEKQ